MPVPNTFPDKVPRPIVLCDASGNIIGVSGAPLYVQGTITVDTSALATAAKQDTGNTSLATIAAAQPFLKSPGSHTAITPSDSTDVSAVASIGLLVTSIAGGASLAVRGTTTSSTTVTIPVVAGQYVYGSFSRVMAATTATVVGLAP